MITLKYKGKEFKITDIAKLYFASDITFSIIIFLWYILYKYEIFTYFSPLFALILTLIQNLFILVFLFYKKKININDSFKYLIILIILKIIPILSFYPKNFKIHLKDIFFILYLYAFYIIILIILVYIFDFDYNIKKIIYSDLSGENYDKTPQNHIYDITYDSLITVLFSNNNSS